MSGREPERLRCEDCGRGVHPDEALYDERADENVCPRCYDERMDRYAERDWDRYQEDLMENGPGPSLAEQQAAARKLK